MPGLGAVPCRIRTSLAEFDGRPGKTNPARHKLLSHMMSGGQKKKSSHAAAERADR